MTKDKISEVLGIYRIKFEEMGVVATPYPHHLAPTSKDEVLTYCCSMLPGIETYLQEDKIGKAFRHLGFIQGCLWTCGIYTVEELKNHNRPDKE